MPDGITYIHDPAAPVVDPVAPVVPDATLIAGEFKTQEEFVAAYQALVAKSAVPPVVPDASVVPPVVPPVVPDVTVQADETLQNVGLSMDEFNTEYAANGELSEASFAKLTAAGIPKAMVEGYIEAMGIKADSMQNEVYTMVGGQDQYQAMSAWASQNMSDVELNAYNKVVTGGDFEASKIAIAGLNAKYNGATGRQGNMLQGVPPSNVGDTFQSNAEVVEAMKDPRYKKDSAYRATVASKLGRSNVLN